MQLVACASLGLPPRPEIDNPYYKYNEWEWNVANRGYMYGLFGNASIWNLSEMFKRTPGVNNPGPGKE
jgi:lipopolysaccharide/colanic/teichoic acid biosynthesis glycosyltransferase